MRLIAAGEALCGEALWAQADGRALSAFVDELRLHAQRGRHAARPGRAAGGAARGDGPGRGASAVGRAPARGDRMACSKRGMSRAELVICAGLNEGTWPARRATDPLLAPAVLRALGVPGADFRIGLAAHDLAGALGAPEVRAEPRAARRRAGRRSLAGSGCGSRRLLGEDLLERHRETRMPALRPRA